MEKEIQDDLDKKPIKNFQDMIDFVEDTVVRHQFYADTPEYCTPDAGSMKFHQDCADRYREILVVLNKIKEV